MSLLALGDVASLAEEGPDSDGQQLQLSLGTAGLRNGEQMDATDADIFAMVDANGNEPDIDCNCDVQKTNLVEERHWGYAEDNGPATWHEKYPLAAGRRQSPVDLSTAVAALLDADPDAKPLERRYNPHAGCVLGNTGHGWKVQIAGPSTSQNDLAFWFSELSGGPLSSHYRLEQFHMHWGDSDSEGSEHTVDGQSFAGELHLVHWNCDKYKSFEEAASQPDGLAAIGVLLEVGEANKELQKVTDLMSQVCYKGQQADISTEVDPANLLPARSSYWTYLGSLTTPPCNESVIWIVFKEQLTVSPEQLRVMRNLRCFSEGEACPSHELQGVLLKNFRPTLPLGARRLSVCRE